MPNLGKYISTVDGIKYYSEGFSYLDKNNATINVSAKIGVFSFDGNDIYKGNFNNESLSFDQGAKSKVLNFTTSKSGELQIGLGISVAPLVSLDIALLKKPDGTYQPVVGASVGKGPFSLSASINFGSGQQIDNLSSYNSYMIYPDGSYDYTYYETGNSQYPGVKVSTQHYTKDGIREGKLFETNITGTYAADMAAGIAPRTWWGPHCFAAGTPITLADGTQKPIEHITPGDEVAAFDCFSKLQSRKVVQLLHNTTDQWIELTLSDGNTIKATPGHRMLTPQGDFRELQALTQPGQAVQLVDQSGRIVEATHRTIHMKTTDRHTLSEKKFPNREKCVTRAA